MPALHILTKRDVIIIIAIALTALGLLLLRGMLMGPSGGASYAQIQLNSQVIYTIPLTENVLFSPNGIPGVVFEIKDGAASFAKADCADQICVAMGRISNPGQMAVCLPNRLILTVVPGEDSPPQLDVDIFVG